MTQLATNRTTTRKILFYVFDKSNAHTSRGVSVIIVVQVSYNPDLTGFS